MNNIAKQNKKWGLVFILLLSIWLLFYVSVPCYASENISSVELEVSQEFLDMNDRDVKDEEVSFRLVPADSETPMPAKTSVDGIYHFNMSGNTTKKLDAITYSKVGIYKYFLELDENQNNKNCTYDKEKYTITVSVLNSKTGGLEARVELPFNKAGDKTANISFKHLIEVQGPKVKDGPTVAPRTGENSAIYLFVSMLLISLGLLLILWKRNIREESETERENK